MDDGFTTIFQLEISVLKEMLAQEIQNMEKVITQQLIYGYF